MSDAENGYDDKAVRENSITKGNTASIIRASKRPFPSNTVSASLQPPKTEVNETVSGGRGREEQERGRTGR